MAVSLTLPTDRAPLSSDPAHQINTFRGLLNVLGDSAVGRDIISWKFIERFIVFFGKMKDRILKTNLNMNLEQKLVQRSKKALLFSPKMRTS